MLTKARLHKIGRCVVLSTFQKSKVLHLEDHQRLEKYVVRQGLV